MNRCFFWKKSRLSFLLLPLVIVFATVSCRSSGSETTPLPTQSQGEAESGSVSSSEETGYPGQPETDQGYPGPTADTAQDSGYPVPDIYEDLSSEPPNPEVELPAAGETTGVVGGVLIREVREQGFEPLTPRSLSLAEVLLNSQGQPAFVRAGADSLKAELFPTGIFIFQNVPPGEYGLMVDVGYAQFPIRGEDGNPRIINVESGSVLNLGQVITELPVE